MTSRKPRTYPWASMLVVPPDPRRKSSHLVILAQRSRYAPLEVFCSNGCHDKGKARPTDHGCRHTDIVLAEIRPWWRSRARVIAKEQAR